MFAIERLLIRPKPCERPGERSLNKSGSAQVNNCSLLGAACMGAH